MILKIENLDGSENVYQVTSYEHEKDDKCWSFNNQEDLEIFIDYSCVAEDGNAEITVRAIDSDDYDLDKLIIETSTSEDTADIDLCNIKLYTDNLVLMAEWKDNKFTKHF